MAEKIVPRFWFVIEHDGKLKMTSTAEYTRYKNSILKPGDHGFITIQKRTRIRSTGAPGEDGNQNGYYWGVILPMLVEECAPDLTAEYFHEICRGMFAGTMEVSSTRIGSHRIPRSTSTMTPAEFSDYIEKIRAFFGAEYGIVFPDPINVEIK